jgi:hypothetical protein
VTLALTAKGGGAPVAVMTTEAVEYPPWAYVTFSVTKYVPAEENTKVVLAALEVALLPNDQRVELTLCGEALQNWTVRGAGPDVTFVVRVTAN